MELLDDKDGVSPSGWVSYYRLNEKHPTILSIFIIFLFFTMFGKNTYLP